MPRQIIVHILMRCDENHSQLLSKGGINNCEVSVEGNLSNELMIKLIDYFQLKIIESSGMACDV